MVTCALTYGIHYRADGSIDFIQTEDGLARRSGTSYSYEYNQTDHLGNVRATFYKNPNTQVLQVVQQDDYYAFGLRKSSLASTNKYLYNGKELQDELNQYDYGARFYDPVIARWTSVDPLADMYADGSPYNYVSGNPINMIDPDGMGETDWYLPKGVTDMAQAVWIDGSGEVDGYKHLGASGYGINEQTGQTIQFNSNGTSFSYAPSLGEATVVGQRTGVGQPGAIESAIPVWGAGRSAVDHFQHGEWVQGSFQTAMAISDLFMQ